MRLGATRADNVYRIGSILRHGGAVSYGTDWPAANYYSTFRPLDAIEIATTRQELPQLGPVAEAISLDDALKASTMGPAYQLGMEREVGSIEVGKLADMVVLERNLFDVESDQIHKTNVLMTVMNGQVRHG